MAVPSSEPAPDLAQSFRKAKYWHTQLESAKVRERSWVKSAKEVIARYHDDRNGYPGSRDNERKVNILWSNTEIQKGALFAELGQPDVRRSFPKPGRANKVARTSAIVLERTLHALNNRYSPESEIRDAIEDSLLAGRGEAWVEYNPRVEQVESADLEATQGEDGSFGVEGLEQDRDPDKDDEVGTPSEERITYQDARVVHVCWEDFRHGPGKKWEDVPWVGRPHFMTREDLEQQFPEHADKIPLSYVLEEADLVGSQLTNWKKDGIQDFERARVWEIWYKPGRIRVYVADDYEFELRRDDDPYRLEGFFPCPRPLYGVKNAGTLMPRPEYLQYQDQAAELDRVNTRIYRLLEKLRYCGVYDASSDDDQALQDIGKLEDGQFIPFKNLSSLSQSGGLAAAFQTRDLAPIAAAIQALSQRAMELINGIYEITGISDILRGSSDPNETAAAQGIKKQSGSQRIQLKQKEVQRFVRDLYRIKAELVAEHFEREILSDMSGILLPLAAEQQQAKMILGQIQAQQAQMQAMVPQVPQGPQSPGPMPAAQQLGAAPAQGIALPPPSGGLPSLQPTPNGGAPGGFGAGTPALPSAAAIGPLQGQVGLPLGALAPQLPPLDVDQLAELQQIVDACSWEDVSGVLRSDDRRNYNINIETTSTAFEDAQEEKAQRLEYLQVMTGMLEKAVPAIQANPKIGPFVQELVLFTSRAMEVGRTLEEALEDTFKGLMEPNPNPPPPSPQEMEAQARIAKIQSDTQIAQLKYQSELQAAQVKHADQLQKAQAEVMKAQYEAQSAVQQMQAQLARAQSDQMAERMKFQSQINDLQGKSANDDATRALKQQEIQIDAALRSKEIDVKGEMEKLGLELKREQVVLNRLEIMLKERQLGLSEQKTSADIEDMRERRGMDKQTADYTVGQKANGIADERAAVLHQQVAQHLAEGHKAIADHLSNGIAQSHQALAAKHDELANKVAQVVGQTHQDLAGKQGATEQALIALAHHLSRPKKIVRDPKTGRPVGVVHDDTGEPPADLASALQNLTRDKKIQRGEDGRISGVA